MPSPNTSWDDIATTTLELRREELADNITDNNSLLFWLKKGGNVDTAPGGRSLLEELEYAESTNFQWITGYQAVNTGAQSLFTAAEYQWKQAVCAVVISGTEMIQNSGEPAKIKLLGARVKNAEKTIMNGLGAGVYSDGLGSDGKQIGGLQYLIQDDPTTSSIVGGINQQTYSFWRNAFVDASVEGAAASSANIRRYLKKLKLAVSRNNEGPDYGVADNNYYTYLSESINPLQVIQSSKLADAGFEAIKVEGVEISYDGGQGGNIPSNHLYLINSKYLKYRPHEEYNIVTLPGNRLPTNQWAMIKLLAWAGNLTCSNRSLQGVLHE